MNGYKIKYSRRVIVNGKFVRNQYREIIIHANTKDGAKAQAEMEIPNSDTVSTTSGVIITQEQAEILSITYLGKVSYRTIVEYIKE